MPFYLEKTKVDLGDTPVENLFMDLYMPPAPGDYVKVYLLGLRYALESREGKRFTTHTLAINVGLTPQQVVEAWEYWEKKGLLRLTPTDDPENPSIEFVSLKALHATHSLEQSSAGLSTPREEEPTPTYTASPSDLVDAHQREEFLQFFKAIDRLLQRPLVPNEEMHILEWIQHYKVDRDVVLLAFQYAVQEREVRSVPYVASIVRNWADRGMTTAESVNAFLNTQKLRFRQFDTIFKSLGFHGRLPSEAEAAYMDKWLDEYRFSLDMVLKACALTAGTSKPSVRYINGILERWHKEGLTSPEAVDAQEAVRKESRKDKEKESGGYTAKKTGFHLPESRGKDYTNDELEKILLGRKRRPGKGDTT